MLREYSKFVEATTSAESDYTEELTDRLQYLQQVEEEVNISLLITGAMGMSCEAGEFEEIVKKTIFQGKPLDRTHLIRELGDVMWYWTNACRALNVDPYVVIEENIKKLKARYPDGEFDTFHSENRKPGDL